MARKVKGHRGHGNASRRRGKSGKGYLFVLLVALFTIIIGIIIIDRYGEVVFKPLIERAFKTDKALKEIKIYFSDEDGTRLVPERRIVKTGVLEAEIREALEILLADPNDSRLASAIPRGARIRSVKIKDGLATIDLSEEIAFKHTGGSSGELMTIYSIVNTVALNFQQVKLVELLIQGRKASTLAGHIDISEPFVPDRKMIRP
ncbi:MAG: GerMN domain-containing protein [Deltaproteobacteria bacterium]|nr:GerMN domain-containing protein [Deltaproteobacteria bacterium]